MGDPDTFDPGGAFRAELRDSQLLDPIPGLTALAESLGVPPEQVVHHALVRWSAAGSEALLASPPDLLVALRDAADAGDAARVRGIVDALLAGWDAPGGGRR
jgi:hypothetical protein